MIQFVEMQCPNCSGNLVMEGPDRVKCSHCGSEFLIDQDKPQQIVHIVAPTQMQPQPPSKRKTVILFVLMAAFALILLGIILPRLNSKSEPVKAEITEEEPEVFSAFLTCFSEEVFHMPPQNAEQKFAEVTYLAIAHTSDSIVVDYALQDGTIHSIRMTGEAVSYSRDLCRFTSLQTLDLKNTSLSESDLEGLNELVEIRTYNSPGELAGIVAHPEKIRTLGSYCAKSLDGVDAFSGLEHLTLACRDELTDLSALSALKQLKSLEIQEGNAITDFGVLQSLNTLEELSIDAEMLKDVSFLRSLTSLHKLSITDSVLLDITPIKALSDLNELCLVDNYEIRDYSMLSELTDLESLTLELCGDAVMPSVENWSQLTSLSVRGADDIGFLTSLPQLRCLCISGSSLEDAQVLADLPQLEELKLQSIYGDVRDLDAVGKITTLKSLDISSMEVYGNVEAIFGIPSLENLNISDCSFGLDFESMPENENLKVLHMDRMELWTNIYVEYDGSFTNVWYDNVNLEDEIGFVSKFPNLEELYLAGNKLTGVDFTENLSKLKKLDIADNYVTDLRPLGKLQYLETVRCQGNAISQGLDLGEGVLVITESQDEFE